jgi:uncharacterized surface protein with fasciclin (FAS1) repeats
MKLSQLSFVALMAANVSAQNFTTVISNQSELSGMSAYISSAPSLQSLFNSVRDSTILSPNNDAFRKLVSGPSNASYPLGNASLVNAILTYHIINGTHRASDITTNPNFFSTALNDSVFANVSSGQVVEAVKQDSTVHFLSGLVADSQVVKAVSLATIDWRCLPDRPILPS